MKVSVYDTYVPKDEKTRMHFDILVQDNTELAAVYAFGKTYLKRKGIANFNLTTKECNFCHMENAPEFVEKEILEKVLHYRMEHCN